MSQMPIRIMQFEFDADELKRNISQRLAGLGLSMTLPYLEPYLIRTMRKALEQTSDATVAQEVKQFIGQEAQHFRQHRKLNDMLRNCHQAYEGLQAIEDQMEADYRRFSAEKSLKFNLAYAEGFEAATCAFARSALNQVNLDSQYSDLENIFIWHLTEEVEHRTVTFNIYKHLYGDYFYRLFVGIYAQYHFFSYVYRFAKFIGDHEPAKPTDNPTTPDQDTKNTKAKGLNVKGISSTISLLGSLLATYLPWYDPAKLKISNNIVTLSARYSEQALEIRDTPRA